LRGSCILFIFIIFRIFRDYGRFVIAITPALGYLYRARRRCASIPGKCSSLLERYANIFWYISCPAITSKQMHAISKMLAERCLFHYSRWLVLLSFLYCHIDTLLLLLGLAFMLLWINTIVISLFRFDFAYIWQYKAGTFAVFAEVIYFMLSFLFFYMIYTFMKISMTSMIVSWHDSINITITITDNITWFHTWYCYSRQLLSYSPALLTAHTHQMPERCTLYQ
jgi:hypothetical protein